MRLRGCIAIEILTGVSMLSGLLAGGLWGATALRAELSQEAEAATAAAVIAPLVVEPLPEPISPPTELNIVIPEPTGMFLGVEDEVLLDPLRNSAVEQVKFNKGGSSISLRIDFENGARAAFKPRQVNWQSVPRREVVAFRLNRLLGLSSVPPAVGRSFPISELVDKLHPDSSFFRPRLLAEMIQQDGMVIGELSWWIPIIKRGTVDGYELDSMEGIVSWKRHLSVGAKIPKADKPLITQISNMVLFDFLISNPDRWSGGNARVSEDESLLYFMDNTLSFGDNFDGHPKARTYLERCQTFSQSLVKRLREVEESEIREVLEYDVEPFEFYLRDEEIAALMSRRDRALEYIDSLISEHGEDVVLAFP